MENNQLLMRSMMVLNQENQVIYLQVVTKVKEEPNYEEVINFLNNIKK
jgi:thiol peroxidase